MHFSTKLDKSWLCYIEQTVDGIFVKIHQISLFFLSLVSCSKLLNNLLELIISLNHIILAMFTKMSQMQNGIFVPYIRLRVKVLRKNWISPDTLFI